MIPADKEPNPLPFPLAQGFRMPAEWEPHEGTWLSWPKDPVTWPERVPQVEKIFDQIIKALTPHEKVFLLVDDEQTQEKLENRLKTNGAQINNVLFYQIPTADSWTRDYGPNFLVREKNGKKELAMNHWRFDAWGGKYKELLGDTIIPKELEPQLKIPRFIPEMVLEGGSIDVNGVGTVLTTEQCLLHPNRNPHLSKEEIQERLKNYLGVRHVIWLGEGIAGDDTDGHVDDVTRFIGPNKVITVLEDNPDDDNYLPLQENLKRLKKSVDQDGKKLEIIPLPMPGFVGDEEGRLPASYANFYIANNVVLVPIFNHKNDGRALEVIKEQFPGSEVVGILCEPLVYGFGALHCVTQQQPLI